MYLDLEVEFQKVSDRDLDELKAELELLLKEKYPDYEVKVTEQDRDEED